MGILCLGRVIYVSQLRAKNCSTHVAHSRDEPKCGSHVIYGFFLLAFVLAELLVCMVFSSTIGMHVEAPGLVN